MKLIPGAKYPTYALEDGKILRTAYQLYHIKKGKKVLVNMPEKFLIGSKLSTKGYPRINIPGLGTRSVHRIIAQLYVGNPQNKAQVNHKDGNKLNNHSSNLEWVSNQENRDHAVENNLIAKGEEISKKLKNEDVHEILKLLSAKIPQKQIAKTYGVVQQTISRINTGIDWNHITKKSRGARSKNVFKA